MANEARDETDPLFHTEQIKKRLDAMIQHLPYHIEKASDPQAKALFEMTREMLKAVVTTYEHYEAKSEAAFR